jgi:hypothetical protein
MAKAEDCGVVSMEKFDSSVRGLLLSVAVFAGLSGRPDLLGLLLVYLLASLSERLGCRASWLCPWGEQAEKRNWIDET